MIEEAKLWLNKADSDLKKAKDNFEISNFDVASFLSQQAAEKSLKAVLINKTKRSQKIHDLVRLGKLVNIPHNLLKDCRELTPVFTETRYPDVRTEEFTQEESAQDIKSAERIITWTKQNSS